MQRPSSVLGRASARGRVGSIAVSSGGISALLGRFADLPLGRGLLGVSLVVIVVGAAWDLIVLVGLAVDAGRRRRARRPIRVGVDYGAGEDTWFETSLGTEPYRSCDTRRLLARGEPAIAARQVGSVLAWRLGSVVVVFTLTAGIDMARPHACGMISSAKTACRTIDQATMMWNAVNPARRCPTVAALKAQHELDARFRLRDPWDSRYEVYCLGDDIICTSPGPDRRPGTEDDIIVQASEAKTRHLLLDEPPNLPGETRAR